jgi:CoA-binding domain
LIVGTNERAINFARQISDRPELGYEILGFVDDDWDRIHQFEVSGYNRCCNFGELANFLRHNVVDEAAIYLPLRSYYEHAALLISQCNQHGIVIRFDVDVFNLRTSRSRALDVDENPHMSDVPGPCEAWPSVVKRLAPRCYSEDPARKQYGLSDSSEISFILYSRYERCTLVDVCPARE